MLNKNITDNNLNCIGRRLYLDLRLSPEVFAHCLGLLSSERLSTHSIFGRDLPDSSFPMDNNMKALIRPKCTAQIKSGTQGNAERQIVYQRIVDVPDTEARATIVKETLIDLLTGIDLENMTSFYGMILRDFDMQCNIVDCYRALYFYKCRQYGEALQLCERILNESDLQNDLNRFSFANVSVIPPLDSFYDGDVQSLLGFHTLFYYLALAKKEPLKIGVANDSMFEQLFAEFRTCTLKGLYRFLCGSYSIRCHYMLGRHFIARYLKVRCCIDYNLPYKEAMTEFFEAKTIFSV